MIQETKTCKKCGKEKPIDSFRLRQDGYWESYCSPCKSEYNRAYKSTRTDYYKNWNKRNYYKYRLAVLARNKLNKAVREGRIEKPEYCELCGAGSELQADHHDYTMPYDVSWLCIKCHSDITIARNQAKEEN